MNKLEILKKLGVPLIGCVLLLLLFLNAGQGYFPIDDSYISLQFAKNLYTTHTLSYNAGEWSAGTTDPLYCVLQAVGYFVTRNWYWAGILIGILSYIACGMAGALFCHKAFGKEVMVYFLFLFLLSGKLIYHAVSGLETVAYSAAFLWIVYALYFKNWVVWGLLLGATYYIRPDVIFLIPVIVIWLILKKDKKSFMGLWLALLAAWPLILFYFNENGTPFPNTVLATSCLMNYHPWIGRWLFLKTCLFFTATGYVITKPSLFYGLQSILPLGLAGMLVWFTPYQKYFLIPYGYYGAHCFSLFIFKSNAAEWQRYLMVEWVITLIAFATLFYWLFNKIKAENIRIPVRTFAVALVMILLFLDGVWQSTVYGYTANYFYDLDVRTGRWIAENTPVDTVIGTYQAGAPKFFGQRYTVDFGGLMQPCLWKYQKNKTGMKVIHDYHIGYIATFGPDFLKPYGIEDAYDTTYFTPLSVKGRGIVQVKNQ